jgi:hypothetical protein
MSVAERLNGPDLPERAELIRAALPDSDRARFDAELDQALDTARLTRDLKPLGRRRVVVSPGAPASPRRLRMGGHRGAASSW